MPDLTLIPGSLPEGYCFTTPQQFNLDIMSIARARFEGSGFTIVLNQEGTPDATQHGFLWRKPSTGLVYSYISGAWVVPHQSAPGGDERRMFIGSLVALQTYDGGAVGAVGDAAGPMWEEDVAFQGRSPMGPGAIPTSNPAKTLNVAEPFGEGAHTQTVEEVGPHTHPLAADADITNVGGTIKIVTSGTGGPGLARGETAPEVTPLSVGPNTWTGGTQQAANVIHPILGIYIIKRTARIYLRGA